MKDISRSTLIGIGAGGIAGLVVAMLSALDILNIPGIGSLAVGGVWVAALVGLTTGGAAGALIGSLAGENGDAVEDDLVTSEK
jgi:hypothetical protein